MKENILEPISGVVVLFSNILLGIASIGGIILGATMSRGGGVLITICILYLCIGFPLMFASIKTLNANEAIVLTLFGKYYGTIKNEGMYAVNPFACTFNPTKPDIMMQASEAMQNNKAGASSGKTKDNTNGKKISLKIIALNNNKQKVNDKQGNPIEIGIVVLWQVFDTAKAIYDVDNYLDYISTQADVSLRTVVSRYAYDIPDRDGGDEKTLRGSSMEIAEELKKEIQSKVWVAGIGIVEARITHLAYAQEIAAAMLQRQQASALLDARKLIVEGAVDMVKMAITQLSEEDIVVLDDERKAAMVSNLLVVLCGNKDAQPIVNSGTLY